MIRWIVANATKFDIIHLHSHLFVLSAVAAIVARVARRPVIMTNHGIVSFSYSIRLQGA